MQTTNALVRQAVVIAVAIGVFGVSFGVLAGATGLPWQMACALSLLVFGGGSQFAAIGVIAAGGTPAAAVGAGLLLNTRYVPFGLAMAPALRGGLLTRMLAAHLVIDESSAMGLGQDDPRLRERAFWITGALVFVFWNAGTAVGALAGQALGDPKALGLDAAFPAGFLALLGPLLRTPQAKRAAVAGAALAVMLIPFSPPGVPVFVAAAGALAGLVGRRSEDPAPAEGAASAAGTVDAS